MKNRHMMTLMVVVFSAVYAAAQSAGPSVTVVGNFIDLPLVFGYIDNYRALGVTVQTIPAKELPSHQNDSVIMILGGQHAPEGIGGIVDSILTPGEKAEVLSSPNAKILAIAANVWSKNQKVMVFAGYEKEQTRKLFGETQGDILKTLRFNDSAFAQNNTADLVPVPPIDPTQPFTEVDAYPANSIIKTIADVVIIDVRGAPFYAAGHIPGAISLPEREFSNSLNTLEKGKTYLLYCGGNSESIKAGNEMSAVGFKRLYRLVDGYLAWRRAGFPKVKESIGG